MLDYRYLKQSCPHVNQVLDSMPSRRWCTALALSAVTTWWSVATLLLRWWRVLLATVAGLALISAWLTATVLFN